MIKNLKRLLNFLKKGFKHATHMKKVHVWQYKRRVSWWRHKRKQPHSLLIKILNLYAVAYLCECNNSNKVILIIISCTKMVYTYVVLGYSNTLTNLTTLFQLPKEQTALKLWERFVSRTRVWHKSSSSSRICSKLL